MKYLRAEEILIIHAFIVDQTGGRHGVRDVGLLASAAERPKTKLYGKQQFPGVFMKAAVYLDSLAHGHVFIDGNKRTALATSARFLHLNGYVLTATNIQFENFILKVVKEKLDLEVLADWFKEHSKKL